MAGVKRKSAFGQAMREAQQQGTPLQSETVEPLKSETVLPSYSETVKQHDGVKRDVKVSFYLTNEQADKLDDLAYQYKQQMGKRVNRNDIVRYLIDKCRLDTLDGLT